MKVLISGASISGPVLAYWLTRYGAEVTVVERSPVLRKTGGHAIDLFKPAMRITEWMGVLPSVEKLATGTNRMRIYRAGVAQPIKMNLANLFRAASDRHVEIMRDDLSEIYYDATAGDVEYIFGDSITEIAEDGTVTFENAPPRRFDIVVGADGLHSNVRRLTFGDESAYSHFIGAYLVVMTVPKDFAVDGEMISHLAVNRMAGLYTSVHMDEARALFLFRRDQVNVHHRDVVGQKELLSATYRGMHPQVDRWLAEMDGTPAFYFDSIAQLRMDTWSRGRVTLVGDAGYCPGPAVGGSTSMAVVGAYTLAGELAAAGWDYERGFAAYEREMAAYVRDSRAFALGAAKTLIPGTRLGVWGLAQLGRAISVLPAGISERIARLNSRGLRLHDSVPVKQYSSGVR